MPPAFNLSQDQTLQFNLLFSLFTSGRSLSESDLNFRSNLTSVRALHYLLASGSKSAAPSIKRPHLSAVCLLKNFAINFVHRVAALSAAEKRDYAELFRRCQQLVEEFLSVNSLPTPRRRFFIHQRAANHHRIPSQPSTTQSTANPLHSCFSTTQHHHRHLRFGAVFCSEGRTIGGFLEVGNTFVVTG